MSTFLRRIAGALSLDPLIFEEVEADAGATRQAALVVVLSSLSAGLGATHLGTTGVSLMTLLVGSLVALGAWVAWAFLTYFIGTRLMPEPQTRADLGQLLRTLGFAASPGLLRVFLVLPVVRPVVFVIVSVWMLAAMVVAVRQALDYRSTARAVGVCLLGWVLTLVAALVVGVVGAPVAE
jgi:hypothetical protein